MPAKAQWLLHVPEILAELSALDVPVVDRAVCERLFRLRQTARYRPDPLFRRVSGRPDVPGRPAQAGRAIGTDPR